jgi:integrase
MSTGHIRQRGRRSWEIKIELDRDAAGKRRTRYHSVKGTRKDAQAKLVQLLSEANRGDYIDTNKETLGRFLDHWITDWATGNVSPKTHERYGQLIAHQVNRHLGGMPIQKVRPVHLTELYGKLLQAGGVDGGPLAARTVGHVHRLLRRALGHAVQWGLIVQNPTAVLHPPRVAQKEIEVIREEEIARVLETLCGRPLHAVAILALATGMRRGELLALRWKDLILDEGRVQVERSLEQTKAGLRFKSPKTKHGRRAITISDSVVAELRAHWTAQQENRLALGLGRSAPDDLVFTAWDGAPKKPNALTNEWLKATTAAGRRISLHALRHTHVSQLIAAGVDILTISRRLGHANPSVTLGVYGHLYGNTDARAAEAVEAMFKRVQTH